MDCLTDTELQAVIDDEATDASRAHVAGCGRCQERAEARRTQMIALASLVENEGDLPSTLEARLREAVASGRPARGATVLRHPARDRSWHPVGWLSALTTAAAVGLVVTLVLPRLGAPTSLSASEILGRSLQTLSSARGIEQLEYELTFAGISDGPHRIEQLLDHEHPTRYRIADYGPDGTLTSAISQDPFTRRRWHLMRVDGRNYIFALASARTPFLSLPQLAQAQVEAVITMMQATSDQMLTVVDAPNGKKTYVIQIPQVTSKAGAGIVDLYQARAVIDASDFHITEFEANGALLKQPYNVSFRLIRQTTRQPADVSPTAFEIQAGPGDVVLEGDATNDPLQDVVGTVLRELGRIKGR
jgi:hypothetical protein